MISQGRLSPLLVGNAGQNGESSGTDVRERKVAERNHVRHRTWARRVKPWLERRFSAGVKVIPPSVTWRERPFKNIKIRGRNVKHSSVLVVCNLKRNSKFFSNFLFSEQVILIYIFWKKTSLVNITKQYLRGHTFPENYSYISWVLSQNCFAKFPEEVT